MYKLKVTIINDNERKSMNKNNSSVQHFNKFVMRY